MRDAWRFMNTEATGCASRMRIVISQWPTCMGRRLMQRFLSAMRETV